MFHDGVRSVGCDYVLRKTTVFSDNEALALPTCARRDSRCAFSLCTILCRTFCPNAMESFRLRGEVCEAHACAFVRIKGVDLCVAAGYLNGTIALWQVRSRALVASWRAHAVAVTGLHAVPPVREDRFVGGIDIKSNDSNLESPVGGEEAGADGFWSHGRDGWAYRWRLPTGGAIAGSSARVVEPQRIQALCLGYGSLCRLSVLSPLPSAGAARLHLFAAPAVRAEKLEVWEAEEEGTANSEPPRLLVTLNPPVRPPPVDEEVATVPVPGDERGALERLLATKSGMVMCVQLFRRGDCARAEGAPMPPPPSSNDDRDDVLIAATYENGSLYVLDAGLARARDGARRHSLRVTPEADAAADAARADGGDAFDASAAVSARVLLKLPLAMQPVLAFALTSGATAGVAGSADAAVVVFALDVAAGWGTVLRTIALPLPGTSAACVLAGYAARALGSNASGEALEYGVTAGWDGALRVTPFRPAAAAAAAASSGAAAAYTIAPPCVTLRAPDTSTAYAVAAWPPPGAAAAPPGRARPDRSCGGDGGVTEGDADIDALLDEGLFGDGGAADERNMWLALAAKDGSVHVWHALS